MAMLMSAIKKTIVQHELLKLPVVLVKTLALDERVDENQLRPGLRR